MRMGMVMKDKDKDKNNNAEDDLENNQAEDNKMEDCNFGNE